jgi:hypothetical protein
VPGRVPTTPAAAHLCALAKARLGHQQHLALLERVAQRHLEQRRQVPARRAALQVQLLQRHGGMRPEEPRVRLQRAAHQVAQLVALRRQKGRQAAGRSARGHTVWMQQLVRGARSGTRRQKVAHPAGWRPRTCSVATER